MAKAKKSKKKVVARKPAAKKAVSKPKAKVVKTAHMTRKGRLCLKDTTYQKINKKGDVKITEVKVIVKPTKEMIAKVNKSNRIKYAR